MTTKQSATASKAGLALRCAEPAPFLKPEFTDDDTVWAERCEHWLTETHKPHRRRALRERSSQPLIFCSHIAGSGNPNNLDKWKFCLNAA